MKDKKIDTEELVKQHIEELKKSNSYAEVNLIIGHNEKMCLPQIKIRNVGPLDVASLIISLRHTADDLEKRFPAAGIITKLGMISSVDGGIIQNKGENED